MATIVQSKTASGTGASSYNLTLDAAATNGNDIILLSFSEAQGHSSTTFGGSAMATSLDTQFGLARIAQFRVTAAGTVCAVTLAGTSNWVGIIYEVSGLTSSPLESTVVYSATGEGNASAHGCDYVAGAASRIGFAFATQGNPYTYNAANGSTVQAVPSAPSPYVAVYKDALGAGAGSLDFTLASGSNDFNYFAATYLTTSGVAAPKQTLLLGVG